jgi:hypothetical protein
MLRAVVNRRHAQLARTIGPEAGRAVHPVPVIVW